MHLSNWKHSSVMQLSDAAAEATIVRIINNMQVRFDAPVNSNKG